MALTYNYDVITYNGEAELFDIRYNILKDYVDEFRVLEFDKTFSGKPKSSTFTQNYPKVKYFYVTESVYSYYLDLAKSSPNTKGASHWITEFCQKESIKDYLIDLKDDDIVFIGDVDEIPLITKQDLKSLKEQFKDKVWKMRLRVYVYWLNNRSSENFAGTIVSQYKNIKNECLNHLRSNSEWTWKPSGWHFTSMAHDLRKKLTDSYTAESYATPQVLDNLETNIKENKDFLGRDFTYTLDESEWPTYLKENREKYIHLIKPPHYPAGDGVKQATNRA